MNADDPSCDPGAISKHGVNGGGESSFSLSPPSVGLPMMVSMTTYTVYVPVVMLQQLTKAGCSYCTPRFSETEEAGY